MSERFPSFLLQFQEPILADNALSTGTETFTKTREEPDQDVSAAGFTALNFGGQIGAENSGTMTKTSAHEETDQDFACLAGTQTRTDSREEQDQDAGNSSYLAIPSRPQ